MRGPRTKIAAPPEDRLFQERLKHNPFWMLVACQLVNLTTWKQAAPVHRWLVATYLGPEGLARAQPNELERVLEPLGLFRRRAVSLVKFANAWLLCRPREYDDVMALPGCGKYAADSWAIFVEGNLDVEPRDGKLNWYLDRRKQ